MTTGDWQHYAAVTDVRTEDDDNSSEYFPNIVTIVTTVKY